MGEDKKCKRRYICCIIDNFISNIKQRIKNIPFGILYDQDYKMGTTIEEKRKEILVVIFTYIFSFLILLWTEDQKKVIFIRVQNNTCMESNYEIDI